MARTKTYGHYCSAARTLEVVGEKWSLLVVRDLLPGPQRFSDLLRTLGGITPKLLTLRLRELEAAGVVARDEEPGRREVWYQLTSAGQALRPVIEELFVWGVEYGAPPRPGESIHPRRAASGTVAVLNRRAVRPAQPTVWELRLDDSPGVLICFDGERWTSVCSGEPDLSIESPLDVWVRMLGRGGDDCGQWLRRVKVNGEPDRREEFNLLFSG